MSIKQNSANFFLNSVFYFLLFLIPFTVVRFYLYFNYFFSKNTFQFSDFFSLSLTGLRFDLCVIGFLLVPSYLMYLLSYFEKTQALIIRLNHIYKLLIVLIVVIIMHLNIPFMTVNAAFDQPFWMRWEDYQSLFGIGCSYCYVDYNYLAQTYPLQIINGLIFILILFSTFSDWRPFSKPVSIGRDVVFVFGLVLMARGNLGQHHLRYEDSIWHKNALMNELSNNPLWLIDKIKSDRRL